MRPFLGTALLLALIGCDSRAPAPVTVEKAWVQLPAVPGRPGAAYFTIRGGSEGQRLIGISSSRSERVELHETRTENGIARMAAVKDVALGDPVAFEPGGRHAMLFGLDRSLKAGDKIRLRFDLQPGPAVETEAEVRAFGVGHSGH